MSSRSRLSSFLSPAAPSGFGLCTLCRVTAPLGNAGKAGLSSATSSSISPPRHPVLCSGAVGRSPPRLLPLQEESASACPAVDLGCRLRGWPLRRCPPAVCPDHGVKAEGAAAAAPCLLNNGSCVLALTVSFMGELHAAAGQSWDAII